MRTMGRAVASFVSWVALVSNVTVFALLVALAVYGASSPGERITTRPGWMAGVIAIGWGLGGLLTVLALVAPYLRMRDEQGRLTDGWVASATRNVPAVERGSRSKCPSLGELLHLTATVDAMEYVRALEDVATIARDVVSDTDAKAADRLYMAVQYLEVVEHRAALGA